MRCWRMLYLFEEVRKVCFSCIGLNKHQKTHQDQFASATETQKRERALTADTSLHFALWHKPDILLGNLGRITMKKICLSATLAIATLFAAPVSAGQCGANYCWGAVAFNPNTGAYGYAYSYFSESDAYNAAQDGCGYNCSEVKTFANQCGAAAIGSNGGFGWGLGPSRGAAENIAMSYCNNYDYGCQVLVWSCSP